MHNGRKEEGNGFFINEIIKRLPLLPLVGSQTATDQRVQCSKVYVIVSVGQFVDFNE